MTIFKVIVMVRTKRGKALFGKGLRDLHASLSRTREALYIYRKAP